MSQNHQHISKYQISILNATANRTWFHHVSHKWRASSRNFEPGLFQSCANSKEGNHIDIARAQTSNSKGFSDVSFLPLHARNSILLQKIAPKPGQHDAQHLTKTRKLVRNPCFFTRDTKGGAQYPTKTGFKKGFPQCTWSLSVYISSFWPFLQSTNKGILGTAHFFCDASDNCSATFSPAPTRKPSA